MRTASDAGFAQISSDELTFSAKSASTRGNVSYDTLAAFKDINDALGRALHSRRPGVRARTEEEG